MGIMNTTSNIWVSRYVTTDYYYYYYYYCMVATSRSYVTVSDGSCVVASNLYSTVSYGGAVQTPGAMCTCRGCTISQQNRVVRTSAFGCLNWAGSIYFVRTFLRGYLWASPIFFFFFFLSTLGIELTFSLYKNIYSRNWRASRAEF